LDDVIKYKWNVLPHEQREGIKNYVSNIIIRLCSDEQTFRRERAFINKLNTILIEVVKQEWPSNWPSFVPDLVAAAKNSETMCENCMYILKVRSYCRASFFPHPFLFLSLLSVPLVGDLMAALF